MFFDVWYRNYAFLISSQGKQNSQIAVFWIHTCTTQTKHTRNIPRTSYSAVLFTLRRYQESMNSTSHIKKYNIYVLVHCENSLFDWYVSNIYIIYAVIIFNIFINATYISAYMIHIIDIYPSKDKFLQWNKRYRLYVLMSDVEIIHFWYLPNRNRISMLCFFGL